MTTRTLKYIVARHKVSGGLEYIGLAETPNTITLNGMEFIRSPEIERAVHEVKAAHMEWVELGDIFPTERLLEAWGAVYEMYGL